VLSSRCRPARHLLAPFALALAALLSPAQADSQVCSMATLKGTYLYNHTGLLNGQPYAESGREVYDGKGGIVLDFRGSDGSGGRLQASYTIKPDCTAKATYPDGQSATSFVSPDGSRFTYTIRTARGGKVTDLAGMEVRVAP
jgi:hypothetical protein